MEGVAGHHGARAPAGWTAGVEFSEAKLNSLCMAWLGGCVYAAELRKLVETWSMPLSPPRSWPRLGAPATCTAGLCPSVSMSYTRRIVSTVPPPSLLLSQRFLLSHAQDRRVLTNCGFTAMPQPFTECPSFLMPPGSNLPCWCQGPGPFLSSGP